MADAYICRRGGSGSGGGSELVIVGGTTSPAKADHNTIWLNTPNAITSYALTATEPTNPVEGMAWITIGASGAVKMVSPVGGDWITVYPIAAKQYVSGAWVDVTAKSYQNGEWVDWWNGELYDSGNQYEAITGGWVGTQTLSGATTSGGKLTVYDDHLHFDNVSYGSFGIVTNNKIDMTNFSYIYVELTGFPRISVVDTFPTRESSILAEFVASSTYSNKTKLSVNISAIDGYHYIAIGSRAAESPPVKVYKVWME